MQETQSIYIQDCLSRLRAGDPAARDDLLRGTSERFRQLCRQMLNSFPRLRRWEETGDVFSGAMMRLTRALSSVEPESPRHFYRLAALQIRRELCDLSRHHFGPQGMGANHATSREQRDSTDSVAGPQVPVEDTHDPQKVLAWTELHQQVEQLPEAEREVFDLVWYHQLPQTEVAALLDVSRRTVIRRWQSACLKLHEYVGPELVQG